MSVSAAGDHTAGAGTVGRGEHDGRGTRAGMSTGGAVGRGIERKGTGDNPGPRFRGRYDVGSGDRRNSFLRARTKTSRSLVVASRDSRVPAASEDFRRGRSGDHALALGGRPFGRSGRSSDVGHWQARPRARGQPCRMIGRTVSKLRHAMRDRKGKVRPMSPAQHVASNACGQGAVQATSAFECSEKRCVGTRTPQRVT